MPTVLRIGPYRFHFYSRENREPPHIHVTRDDIEVKFWLNPVRVARNFGYPTHELNEIVSMVEQYNSQLLEAWQKFHG